MLTLAQMHTLHTTQAFILSSTPHGESNRVYRLLTRSLGLVYARAQGVRELRNRNRYALSIGARVDATLVRGREAWKLTSAARHALDRVPGENEAGRRRVLALAGRLVPLEHPLPSVFDALAAGYAALGGVVHVPPATVEAVVVLHILRELGYVSDEHIDRTPLAGIYSSLAAYDNEMLTRAHEHHGMLVVWINNALREANV